MAGEISINVEWGVNEFKDDALISRISSNTSCNNSEFVQVAKVLVDEGKDLHWKKYGGMSDRNNLRYNGFFVDINNTKCQKNKPCSPYYTDHFPEESQKGSYIKMLDAPYGWTEFEEIHLETCVLCQDTGQYLSCVKWGGGFYIDGEKKVFPISKTNKPSKDFRGALGLFREFYKKKP